MWKRGLSANVTIAFVGFAAFGRLRFLDIISECLLFRASSSYLITMPLNFEFR